MVYKISLRTGLVRTYAVISLLGQFSKSIMPVPLKYLKQWNLISICLVFNVFFFRLNHFCGGLVLTKLAIVNFCVKFRSFNNLINNMVSSTSLVVYPTSAKESAAHDCLFVDHWMKFWHKRNRLPVVHFLYVLSWTQSM